MNIENSSPADYSSSASSSPSINNSDSELSSDSLTDKHLLVVHQNIRSLRKNCDSLVCHLSSFSFIPHFNFSSEIWIYSNEKNDYNLPGFNFHSLCNDSYSSGGVAVFVKCDYDCLVSYFRAVSADILQINCLIDGINFAFLCVYRFIDKNIPQDTFLKELVDIVSKLKTKNLIVLGDLNIDSLSTSLVIDKSLFNMSSFGLLSVINTIPLLGYPLVLVLITSLLEPLQSTSFLLIAKFMI